jgi:hypothetical protein
MWPSLETKKPEPVLDRLGRDRRDGVGLGLSGMTRATIGGLGFLPGPATLAQCCSVNPRRLASATYIRQIGAEVSHFGSDPRMEFRQTIKSVDTFMCSATVLEVLEDRGA